MAFEFTPEITQDYLNQLQRPIQQQGAVDVGRARGEALRRGMAGDPFEALRVGAAQNTMNTNLANTNANLRFNVAGVQQQERVGNERMLSEQNFRAAEAQKQRDFDMRMEQMRQTYAKQLANAQRHAQKRSFYPNLAGNMLGMAAGGAGGYWMSKMME